MCIKAAGMEAELSDKITEYQTAKSKLKRYARPDTITHIFFHSLIVDTKRAFDGDVDQNGYNMYMTTVDEFNAILEQMYQSGYVLISPYDMAYEVTDESGTHFTYGEIRLPAGKKPFLMSQDDLNYYSYMIGTGSGINETPVFADTNGDGSSDTKIGYDGNPIPVESIKLAEEYLVLRERQKTQLHAVVFPMELAEFLYWSVEKGSEEIIEVTADGTVTACSVGTGYAIATLKNGNLCWTQRCRVDVAETVVVEMTAVANNT